MGKFEYFENLPDGSLKKVGEDPNRILYDGREFIEDIAFGINSWFRGALTYDGSEAASGYWNPTRIIAVGKNADDNSGWLAAQGYLAAGSGLKTATIPTTGQVYAHLPNLEDTCMTSAKTGYATGNGLWYKAADKIIRTGRAVIVEATFQSTTLDSETGADTIKTGQELRELGIFLGGDPTGVITPSTDVSQRPWAIIARSVRFKVTGSYVEDNPLIMGENPLTVRYTIGDT